jgi:hypothetical protein
MKNFDVTRQALVNADWKRRDRTVNGIHEELWREPGTDRLYYYGNACTRAGICPSHQVTPVFITPHRSQRPKPLQAKHLSDVMVLNVIRSCQEEKANTSKYWGEVRAIGGDVWGCVWDIFHNLPQFPEKLLNAKFESMARRGLIDGCFCGCRGDIVIEEKGYALLEGVPPIKCRLKFKEIS